MKNLVKIVFYLLFILGLSYFAQAQNIKKTGAKSFYLELNSCNACGNYGNKMVQLFKKNGINAFNGQARCYGSCFSTNQFAVANKIAKINGGRSPLNVLVGPFNSLDIAFSIMNKLKDILKPVFTDWREGFGNTYLEHDSGNYYKIQPLHIWIIKKN